MILPSSKDLVTSQFPNFVTGAIQIGRINGDPVLDGLEDGSADVWSAVP